MFFTLENMQENSEERMFEYLLVFNIPKGEI